MPEETSIPSYASREEIPVHILLSTGSQLKGTIFISPEPKRFSDAWEEMMRDPRSYVAVTENESPSAAEGTFAEESGFLLVRKSDIIAVRPANEE